MPNCNFYGVLDDHAALLDWLFAGASCHIYELASAPEQPLRQFQSTDEVLCQFDRCYPNGKPWSTVYLQLYVRGASPSFTPRRIELNPDACDGATFRYNAEGWGLVQLYLGAERADYVSSSHTNHNSEKRAQIWYPTTKLEPGPDAWDFRAITAFSSRLNNHIRKQAVGKLGSTAVLPGAFALWEQGKSLSPYQPGRDILQVKSTQPKRR
jgi:hypothetical protein